MNSGGARTRRPALAARVATALATAIATALAATGCGGTAEPDAGDGPAAPLGVAPAAVVCAVGERVRLAVVPGVSAARSYEFAESGDVVRLAVGAGAERGTATATCAAAGAGVVLVSDGRSTVSVPVRVAAAPGAVVAVDVEPTALALVTASTWRLAARARTRDTSVSAAVRYASLDTGVVAVDAEGVVRAVAPGAGTVVVSAAADPSVRAPVAVTVARGSALVQGIFVAPGSLTLVVGETAQLRPTVLLAASAPPGTTRDVVYSTSDTLVAAVSPSGVVRARSAGTAFVRVIAAAAPALRAAAVLRVLEPAPDRE